MSVNGGGANPHVRNFRKKLYFFFLKREKDTECSETEKYVFCQKINQIKSKTNILDHSGSFDMHIGKHKKTTTFFGGVRKKTGFCRTGGVAQKVMDMSATYKFFIMPSLREDNNKKFSF